ncbi:hypothetical protein GGI07_005260 [Coemansia sp. Benny D115]|nr:hypothetical protein GGI07_005260 [Coemansia sp. Benny D115]
MSAKTEGNSLAPLTTVEAILRSRLLVDDRSLRRCLRQLSTACSRYQKLTAEETQEAAERVLREVRWFEHTTQIALQSQARCEKELHAYAEQTRDLEDAISTAELEVSRLGDRLEESRSHKRHKIAYDEIAAEANKRPSRQKLQTEIDDLYAEIEQLQQEDVSLDSVVGSLRQQYNTVNDELRRLADIAAAALSMQDLGIILAEADAEADPHVSSLGISPATPHQSDATQPHFDTPAENDDDDDDDVLDASSQADNNKKALTTAAASHSADEGEEVDNNSDGEHSDNEEDGALATDEDFAVSAEAGDNSKSYGAKQGLDAHAESPDQGEIVSEEEGECEDEDEDEEGELMS